MQTSRKWGWFALGGLVVFLAFSPLGKRILWGREPPVQVSLVPFLLLDGHYVQITNLSPDKTLIGVQLEYRWQGNAKSQWVGNLAPGQRLWVDPSAAHITVRRNEHLAIWSQNFPNPKVLDTNSLFH